MILAYHSIFSMYGFWLPNDPRGSGSDYIASWELFRCGRATKITGNYSVAHQSHDEEARRIAKTLLKFPPVEITGIQALAVADGFARAAKDSNYIIHACAILPNHVHLVIGRHERRIRRIVGHMKSRATMQLNEAGMWHEDHRPVWGERGWNVYLDTVTDVERAIAYVEQNPVKDGRKRQYWKFITPFNSQARCKHRG